MTSPFLDQCISWSFAKILCQNYRATTMKKVPNESKLTYAINVFTVASWGIRIQKCHLFGVVNVNVHGLRDNLNFTSTLNAVLMGKLKCNYFYILLSLSVFYLLFCKIAPINFVKVIFDKYLETHCLKRRRHIYVP